jgi:hypothetical protein
MNYFIVGGTSRMEDLKEQFLEFHKRYLSAYHVENGLKVYTAIREYTPLYIKDVNASPN